MLGGEARDQYLVHIEFSLFFFWTVSLTHTHKRNHTHIACVRSRAEDLTFNVRAYALGRVYKTALYTVHTHAHTHTHIRSRAVDLTLNVRTYTHGYTSQLCIPYTHTYAQLIQLQLSYAFMRQLLLPHLIIDSAQNE